MKNKIFIIGFAVIGYVSTLIIIINVAILIAVSHNVTGYRKIDKNQILGNYTNLNNNVIYAYNDFDYSYSSIYYNDKEYSCNFKILWMDDMNILFRNKNYEFYLMNDSYDITLITKQYISGVETSFYYHNFFIYYYKNKIEKKYFKFDSISQENIEIDKEEYYLNRDGITYSIDDSDIESGIKTLNNSSSEMKLISYNDIYNNSIIKNFNDKKVSYSDYYIFNNEMYLKYVLDYRFIIILKYNFNNGNFMMYDFQNISYDNDDMMSVFFSNKYIDERIHYIMNWCKR